MVMGVTIHRRERALQVWEILRVDIACTGILWRYCKFGSRWIKTITEKAHISGGNLVT